MSKHPYLNTLSCAGKIGVYAALSSAVIACSPLRPFSQQHELRGQMDVPPAQVGNQVASVATLPIEHLQSDTFWVKPQFSEGALPSLRVENLSVTERGLYDVLQLLFNGTNMPLSFEGGPDAAARYGVVTLNNLNGDLPSVMNKLGEIMGFFWTVSESGVLRIMPEQQFVVTMPPVLNEDSMAGITNTMQFLGARDVYLDRINRSLVFRANRRALGAIQEYLARARATRSLVVYEMHVLQVDLNDNNNMGIRWELYKTGAGLNAGLDAPIAGASSTARSLGQISRTTSGLETLIFGENFQTNVLIDFLKTQGDVKTLSQPKIGLMNGTNGAIRVGQSTTFVSRVGSQIVNGVAQSTADTQSLRTGLEISLTGEVHDSTIYTRINISITELLALKRFTALGVDLNLPEVADRELKTQVRSRPGDTVLLGGITVTRSQDDFQTGALQRSRSESTKQTELVITMRPRLLMFDAVKPAAPAELPPAPVEQHGAQPSPPPALPEAETAKPDYRPSGELAALPAGLKLTASRVLGNGMALLAGTRTKPVEGATEVAVDFTQKTGRKAGGQP